MKLTLNLQQKLPVLSRIVTRVYNPPIHQSAGPEQIGLYRLLLHTDFHLPAVQQRIRKIGCTDISGRDSTGEESGVLNL